MSKELKADEGRSVGAGITLPPLPAWCRTWEAELNAWGRKAVELDRQRSAQYLEEIRSELGDPSITSFAQVATGIRDMRERIAEWGKKRRIEPAKGEPSAEQIMDLWYDVPSADHETKTVAFAREVLARYGRPAAQAAEPVQQYFFKMYGCPVKGASDDGCICWHDQGTGHFPDAKPGDENHVPNLEWRAKPAPVAAQANTGKTVLVADQGLTAGGQAQQDASAAEQARGGSVADRLDAMADQCAPGSQAMSDLYAAATAWRKHLAGPQRAAQPSEPTQQDAAAIRNQALDALIEVRTELEAITLEDTGEHYNNLRLNAAIEALKAEAAKQEKGND